MTLIPSDPVNVNRPIRNDVIPGASIESLYSPIQAVNTTDKTQQDYKKERERQNRKKDEEEENPVEEEEKTRRNLRKLKGIVNKV